MSATIREVRARIGAARLTLNQMSDSSARTNMSRLQAGALLDQIRSVKDLGPAEAAALAEEVARVPWCTGDLERILDGLHPVQSRVANRRAQQNFLQFLNYLPAKTWSVLQSPQAPPSNKLHEMLVLACRLGMRCPSEHTTKWLTSAWLLLSKPEAELVVLDVVGKLVALSQVKSQLKNLLKGFPDPAAWVSELPSSPTEYMTKWPSEYRAALGGEHPIVPPIDMQRLVSLDMSYGCRGGLKKPHMVQTQLTGGMQNQLQPVPAASSGDPPAAMMMQMVQALFERMLPPTAPTLQFSPAAPMPMMQLTDRQPTMTFAAPEAASPGPPLMSPTALEAAPAAAPGAGSLETDAASPAAAAAEAAEDSYTSSADDRFGHLESVLRAIDERKEKPAAKAKLTVMKRPAAAILDDDQPDKKARTFGCSKCRWSVRGCSACRDPKFKGLRWNASD